MKIILFGGKGNLGTQINSILSDDDEVDLISWDMEDIDIMDFELVQKKIEELKPSVIINATAYNALDKCEEDEEEYEKAKILNSATVGNLAQIALENQVLLVHFSSDYVFGNNDEEVLKSAMKNGGYCEDDTPAPINKYAETKLAGEKEIISKSGKGLKYYIIRTSKIFGPKGESEHSKPNFFDIMLKLARSGQEIKVVDSEESCFTYSIDLARAVVELINEKPAYGIYHIVNSGSVTWYEGAKEVFGLSGLNPKVVPVTSDELPRPAKRPKYSVLKNTKLKPLRDYQEALKEYLGM